jgi:hypothetical protein
LALSVPTWQRGALVAITFAISTSPTIDQAVQQNGRMAQTGLVVDFDGSVRS